MSDDLYQSVSCGFCSRGFTVEKTDLPPFMYVCDKCAAKTRSRIEKSVAKRKGSVHGIVTKEKIL